MALILVFTRISELSENQQGKFLKGLKGFVNCYIIRVGFYVMFENQNNLINIDFHKDDVHQAIYRVFPLERFLTSLHENQLFFVKTKLWDDPFEAFLLKQQIYQNDEKQSFSFDEQLTENFYGQCWTYLRESNLLWKVYAPNNDGIIVKSSLKKLSDLFLNFEPSVVGNCFIGKINYLPEEKIKEDFENSITVDRLISEEGAKILLQSLFIKRIEFKQEEEVRIVIKSETYGKGISLIKIGYTHEKLHLFNELADELILDPRIDDIRAQSIISLIKKLGYTGKILHSRLFRPPLFRLKRGQ